MKKLDKEIIKTNTTLESENKKLKDLVKKV